jgi:hypothetical protein
MDTAAVMMPPTTTPMNPQTAASIDANRRGFLSAARLAVTPTSTLRVMRKASPEAIYLARRIAVRNSLQGQGVSESAAEQWLTAWEAEARSQGLDPRAAAFWEPADGWIAEQRRSRTPSAVTD